MIDANKTTCKFSFIVGSIPLQSFRINFELLL